MASSSREDSQLMRQRGAGACDLNNAAVGISFDNGTSKSRQERQLMRQRGAGTRAIHDVDFGIRFPTPTQSRRSAPRSPKPAQRHGRRSKTPARSSREPSIPQSRGTLTRTHRTSSRRANIYEVPEEAQVHTSPTSKRRKLSHQGNPLQPLPSNTSIPPDLASQRTASSSEIHTAPPVRRNTLPNEGILSPPPSYDDDDENDVENTEHPDAANKENESPLPSKSQPKRRKRKSIGQQSTKRKKRPSTGSQRGHTDDLGTDELPSQVSTRHSSPELVPREPEAGATLVFGSPNEPRKMPGSDRAKKPRKKRKSIVLGRKKRRSSDHATRLSAQGATSLAEDIDKMIPAVVRGKPSKAGHRSDEGSLPPVTNKIERRRRAKMIRSNSPNEETLPTSPIRQIKDADDEEDESYVEEELSPEPETPAVVRKRRRPASTEDNAAARKRSQNRSTSGFEIVTHRLVNTRALPTIVEQSEAETNSESEDMSYDLQLPSRAPNAVDVLAQYCREFIEKAIEKIDAELRISSSKAGGLRKRTALEAFGAELDTRLFDMSHALENRLTSEARVRRSKREKADLESQWTEIRRQREEVALKTDAIRRKNWRSEADGREKHELSQHLRDLELMVERNEGVEDEDLEHLLQDVAGHVSNDDGGNLLAQIKAFNSQLERTAAVFEGGV